MTARKTTATEFESEMAAIRRYLAVLRNDHSAIARNASKATSHVGDALRDKAAQIRDGGPEIVSPAGRVTGK